MSPSKLVFNPQLLPDGNVKAIKSYLEWLNLTDMEKEVLSRYTVERNLAPDDGTAFWIFEDSAPVRAILHMEAST